MNVEAYNYTLPDGYIMKPQFRVKLDCLVEKAALDNTEAQAFVDLHVELMEEYAAAVAATLATVLPKVAATRQANTAPVVNDTPPPRRAKYGKKQSKLR